MRSSRHHLRRTPPSQRLLAGFTVVELLVSIAIMGLLIAVLLPAVQQVRSAARNAQCRSNLHQIGIAAHAYSATHGRLPDRPRCILAGLLSEIDPQEEQSPQRFRFPLRSSPIYQCPADTMPFRDDDTSYAVNVGLLDILGVQRAFQHTPLKWSQVTDGLSQTAFVSERYCIDGGNLKTGHRGWFVVFPAQSPMTSDSLNAAADWCVQESQTRVADFHGPFHARAVMGGYNHVLPPNAPTCLAASPPFEIVPAWSAHYGGVHVLWADGSVKFMGDTIDLRVWRAMGTIDGGEVIDSML